MKSFDTAKTDIKSVREAMNGRIGEIITAVIGNDTLQKIFEDPEHNAKYIELNQKGTPSGIIALELGIVDAETKTALLVAQAAERIALNAERMREIANGVSAPKEWLISAANDPVFKFVGSDRDPKILQESQASWQISQVMLLVQNHDATADESDNSLINTVRLESKPEYVEGLLKSASGYYAAASQILSSKGFEEAAIKLQAVANIILPENAAAIKITPHDMAVAYARKETEYRNEMRTAMSSDHYTNNDLVELGEKLARLTEGQKASAPAPNSTPRKDM